jgi:hypothetical protein
MQKLTETSLWKDATEFLSKLPAAPQTLPQCRDPRLKPSTIDPNKPPTPDPKLIERLTVLTRKLKLSDSASLAEIQKMMATPEYKELTELSQKAQNTPEMQAYSEQQIRQSKEIQQYDLQTKAWLKSTGFDQIAAWRGKAVVVFEGLQNQVTRVEFTTTKRYFDTGCGRQVWSGPCVLTAAHEKYPERRYDRTNPATLQFFIGQEGYFLKYSGAAFGTEQVQMLQPVVASHLFEMPKTGQLRGSLGEPGSEGVFGFPFGASGKRLVGSLKLALPNKSIYSIGWEMQPA